MLEFKVGMRLKRKSRGNLERGAYEAIKDKIIIVTKVTDTHISFRREDDGSLMFRRNTTDYASAIFESAKTIHVGGE